MQDWVTVAVGVVLIALAAVLLIAGIIDFLDGSSGPISAGAPILLDRVLLVLILVEIVYTVVLSLRAHRLVAQPFIVVGLIAVVRRILFVLTPGSTTVSTSELRRSSRWWPCLSPDLLWSAASRRAMTE